MKFAFFLLLLIGFCNAAVCQVKSINKKNAISEPIYFFVDSSKIGRKALNKIEIAKFADSINNFTFIRFYSKANSKKWILRNEYKFETETLVSCRPEITDFNNDRMKDFTYVSATAARGANEIRKLFIYDRGKDTLTYVKNSEEYPNLLYNKRLNCIDAFLVYGGCSTVFLKLRKDILQEFASVELSDGLTISEYDKKGKERIIFTDPKNKAGYVRYISYKPLIEYTGVY